jgi:CheY-like chemotaxis protein
VRLNPQIPIVLCTRFNQDLTPERIRKAGIRELIMKPVVIAELAAKIRNVLSRKQS